MTVTSSTIIDGSYVKTVKAQGVYTYTNDPKEAARFDRLCAIIQPIVERQPEGERQWRFQKWPRAWIIRGNKIIPDKE